MFIEINDDNMQAKRSGQYAEPWQVRAGEEPPGRWRVSWLPAACLDRNEAISAMVLAETVAAHPGIGPEHPQWPFVESWAAELGLSPEEAVARVRESPGREMGE